MGRAVGGALMMNPDRLVCGLATVFGTRTRGGRIWYREEFDAWHNSGVTAVPLQLGHGPVFDIHGAITNIGAAREFAVVNQPVHGLLTLVELDQGGWQDSLLRDIQEHLDLKPWLPALGFSLGGSRPSARPWCSPSAQTRFTPGACSPASPSRRQGVDHGHLDTRVQVLSDGQCRRTVLYSLRNCHGRRRARRERPFPGGQPRRHRVPERLHGGGDVINLLDRRLYTFAQVDDLLSLSPSTAQRWIDGYSRQGKDYRPVVGRNSTGIAVATWGKFCQCRFLAEFVTLGLRRCT